MLQLLELGLSMCNSGKSAPRRSIGVTGLRCLGIGLGTLSDPWIRLGTFTKNYLDRRNALQGYSEASPSYWEETVLNSWSPEGSMQVNLNVTAKNIHLSPHPELRITPESSLRMLP